MDYKNRDYAKKLIKEFDVRTPSEKVLKSLSGGNQQNNSQKLDRIQFYHTSQLLED